ncbi:MAG: 3-deoxy-8-phosphooctulonate synthase [Rhodobacterales bacterium]|nr:3-deoxy-8-phosphooctulonate synthase [Rhodobacterales bacterium]
MVEVVNVAGVSIGPGCGLVFIAGPCVLEGADRVLRIARGLREISERLSVPLIFKASFDKANRTSLDSYRGPGLHEGLALLDRVRSETGLRITTDVHLPSQVEAVGQVVDLIQIPAFLCRQTDLLVAAAQTGLPINIKKAQFAAPQDMKHAVHKCRQSGVGGVMLTERGTHFGHGDLVVDFRGVRWMHALGVPVVYDATHSLQQPGGRDRTSGGLPDHVPALARAAVATGVDAVFAEVHDRPEEAKSDAATQMALADFEGFARSLLRIREALAGV